MIFQVGRDEASHRHARDLAFEAKRDLVAGSPDRDVATLNHQYWRFSAKANATLEQAQAALDRYNSTSWFKGYGKAHAAQRDKYPEGVPLIQLFLRNVAVYIDVPSFDVPKFMLDVGSQPFDQQYSLLLPMSLEWQMSSAKCLLRDFPMPLLNIPPRNNEPEDYSRPSWTLTTNFVIAEEASDVESLLWTSVPYLPQVGDALRQINVSKNIMPTKTYCRPSVVINSNQMIEFISWGTAVQPALHEVIRLFDTFTRPPADHSDKLGFWDKLRLIMHWQVKLDFIGDGHLRIYVKGTVSQYHCYVISRDSVGAKDPYALSDGAAGLVFSYHRNTQLLINMPNEHNEFIQIRSQSLFLGVPECVF